MTAHDWLCAGAVLAGTFGAFLALIWAEPTDDDERG